MTNWKPFHHDAAGLDKDAGKGKGGEGKGGGKGSGKGGGKGGGRPPMCETQNMTVGVSFGEARQAAFEWAGAREKKYDSFPEHLWSPAVHAGKHSNVVLSLTLPDSSTYTFGRDVNLLWKHGILAEKTPSGKMSGRIDVEEGRISIIAWGWVDQYDELDQYLAEEKPQRPLADENATQERGRGRGGRGWGDDDGRGRGPLDERRAEHKERRAEHSERRAEHSRSPGRDRPDRDRPDRGADSDRPSERARQGERGGRSGGEWGGGERGGERGGDSRRDEWRRDEWRRDEGRRDDRDRHMQHGWSSGGAGGIDRSDPDEMARREARAAKFGTR